MANLISGIWDNASAIRPGGIVSLMAKCNDDDAFYHLGNGKGSRFEIKAASETVDYYGRPMTYGNVVEGVFRSVQSSLTEIEKLGTLVAIQPTGVIIQYADSHWVTCAPSAGLLSLKWRLISDGDRSGHRLIEYMVRGNVTKAEVETLVVTSQPTIGTPNAEDNLYGLLQTAVVANQAPNGVTKIELKEAAGDDYADLGSFRDAKWTFECVGDDRAGARGHYGTTAVKFTFDALLLSSVDNQINLLDVIHSNDLSLQLTHSDGVVLTMASPMVGVTIGHDSGDSMEKTRTMPMHAEGVIPIANPATFGTTWAGLWA
jgi:hypothetical protein